MLFNSYIFIFGFLPAVFAGFLLLGQSNRPRAAMVWLALASLCFYGWWNWKYLFLLGGSIVFNYAIGYALGRAPTEGPRRKWLLFAGVAVNLGLLGYYKYANFFASNLGPLVGLPASLGTIVLPLGISFFTFTQIAYLVDVRRGLVREYNFAHYVLFVTFFPHLVAGPILHHKEMMPQFDQERTYRLDLSNVGVGWTLFALGLCKKALLADGIAPIANSVFDAASAGVTPTLLDGWAGALAYTLQLYFDFSGYSDMAIGLALLFNIRLPMNFYSPYKSDNIIEFWRRWHMTLSRYLRDYLYIPLGGNRKGRARRYLNLMITMVLGGLWHGAGWTFVAWGTLHGAYLMVNHAWRGLWGERLPTSRPATLAARALTFVAVVVAWVPFRAPSLSAAGTVLSAMAGRAGISLSPHLAALAPFPTQARGFTPTIPNYAPGLIAAWIGVLLLVVMLAPNTLELTTAFEPTVDRLERPTTRLRWLPTLGWSLFTGAVFAVALLGLARHSEFLYFQF